MLVALGAASAALGSIALWDSLGKESSPFAPVAPATALAEPPASPEAPPTPEQLASTPPLRVATNVETRASDADHVAAAVAAGTAEISGFARDSESGLPVERFRVLVTRGSEWVNPRPLGTPSLVVYDGEAVDWRFEGTGGEFRLRGLEGGWYALQFEADGYARDGLNGLNVGEGETKSGIEILLRRSATMRGSVLDAATRIPIPGARISAETIETETSGFLFRSMISGTATSGKAGEFELVEVRPGRSVLRVTSEGYAASAGQSLVLRPGQVLEGLLVKLARGGAIEGSVFESDGTPVPRILVHAERAGPRPAPERDDQTEPDGSFRIQDLEPGRYRVIAELPAPEDEDPYTGERRELRAIAVVERGTTARVELSARAMGGCTVRGRVTRRGESVRWVQVSLESRIPGEEEFPPSRGRRPIPCMTSEDGSYAIREVPAGQATMWVSQALNRRHRFPLTIPEAGELVFDVQLPGGAIAGRVVRASNGSPVLGAELSASCVDGESSVHGGTTRTDEDGRYRIEDLSPGNYSLHVDPAPANSEGKPLADDLASDIRRGLAIAGNVLVVADFTLGAAGRALVIMRDASGRPVTNASVSLRPVSGSGVFGRIGDQLPSARDRGEYLLVGIPPGRYYAHVLSLDSWENGWSEEGSVVRGEPSEFHVQLQRGTRVDVKLVVEGGPAPTDALLRFKDGKKEVVVDRSPVVVILSGGKVDDRRTLLPPGNWTLLVSAEGYREESIPVVVEEGVRQEVSVHLEPEESPR